MELKTLLHVYLEEGIIYSIFLLGMVKGEHKTENKAI